MTRGNAKLMTIAGGQDAHPTIFMLTYISNIRTGQFIQLLNQQAEE
jgi:hypothetical protein